MVVSAMKLIISIEAIEIWQALVLPGAQEANGPGVTICVFEE